MYQIHFLLTTNSHNHYSTPRIINRIFLTRITILIKCISNSPHSLPTYTISSTFPHPPPLLPSLPFMPTHHEPRIQYKTFQHTSHTPFPTHPYYSMLRLLDMVIPILPSPPPHPTTHIFNGWWGPPRPTPLHPPLLQCPNTSPLPSLHPAPPHHPSLHPTTYYSILRLRHMGLSQHPEPTV